MKIWVIGEGYEFMVTIERMIDFDLNLFLEFYFFISIISLSCLCRYADSEIARDDDVLDQHTT